MVSEYENSKAAKEEKPQESESNPTVYRKQRRARGHCYHLVTAGMLSAQGLSE